MKLDQLQRRYLALEIARLEREARRAAAAATKKRRTEEILSAATPVTIAVGASVALAALVAWRAHVDVVMLFTSHSTSALLALVTTLLDLISIKATSLVSVDNLKTVLVPLLGIVVAQAAINRTLAVALAITLTNLLIAAVFVVISAATTTWPGLWVYGIVVLGVVITSWTVIQLLPLGFKGELSLNPIFDPVLTRIAETIHWPTERRHTRATQKARARGVPWLAPKISISFGGLFAILAMVGLLGGLRAAIPTLEAVVRAVACAPLGLWLLVRFWRSIWLGAAFTAFAVASVAFGDGSGLLTFLLVGFGTFLAFIPAWLFVRVLFWGLEGVLTQPAVHPTAHATIVWMPLLAIEAIVLVEVILNTTPVMKYVTTLVSTIGVLCVIAFVAWFVWAEIAANLATKALFLTLFCWEIAAVFVFGSDPLALLAGLVMALTFRRAVPAPA